MRQLAQKILSGFLSLAVIVSYPMTCVAKNVRFGDVNGDSAVNASDALAVLNYCVGNLEFSPEAFLRADVNADKNVNSIDALEILKYTVSEIDRFKAEDGETVDTAEAIDAYNKAIEKVKSFKPFYTMAESVSNNVDDINVSFKNSLVSDERLREIEERTKKENNYKKDYSSIIKQKSDDSAEKMLGVLDGSEISRHADVECFKNESGRYMLTVKFKDEKNPTENSWIVKILGCDSYDTAKQKVKSENEVGGVKSNVEAFDFVYKDCYIKCEIDPLTSEFIEIEWFASCISSSKVTTIGLTVEMTTTGKNAVHCSYFGY